MAKPTSHKAPCERQKNSPASEIKTVLLTRVEIGELEVSQPGQGAARAHTVCDTASAIRGHRAPPTPPRNAPWQ